MIKRSRTVSIAKSVLGATVSASLKFKYAIDENGEFTEVLLLQAIKREIKDEIHMEFDDLSLDHIVAFYQNYLEGGKPQLLVMYYSELTSQQIIQVFNAESSSDGMESQDGNRLLPLDMNQINCIETNSIKVGKKTYEVFPDTLGTLGYVLELYKNKHASEQ